MNRIAFVLPLLAACLPADDDALSETESAGTSYQGTSYQGTSYQGTSYQGTSYQGASYGNAGVTGKVVKTTLETWRQVSFKTGAWEQRLPDRVCTWDRYKIRRTCSIVNLATTPSPLAGVTFQATFADPQTGVTRQGRLRIGASTSDVGAVTRDTTYAMHPLDGAGATGAKTSANCTHPGGCRQNSDLWLYDVELVDTDGHAVHFCNGNERAFALAGTWDLAGNRDAQNTAQFTFACTNGTIAKCTRWGYRPWGYANKSNGVAVALPDYHQACIRAATADYCANGTSFTKDGTLIDIWDYQPHQPGTAGLIPRTQSLYQQASAFAWESQFDKHGGTELDFVRYAELGRLDNACPGRFSLGTAPEPHQYHIAPSRGPSTYEAPFVSVDTTSTCAHDESTRGRWLHPKCSSCTYKLWEQYGDIWCLRSTWDQGCIDLAMATCTPSERMAKHSECTTGAALELYDSACTLDVCGDPYYASCCSSGWTSACTAAANARCMGGREGWSITGQVGFCGVAIPLVLQ